MVRNMKQDAIGKGGQDSCEDATSIVIDEGARVLQMSGEKHPWQRSSQCKGPVVETHLVSLRNKCPELELSESGERCGK